MPNNGLQPLSAGNLRLAYADFARTSRRPSWWGAGTGLGIVTNSAGAFGLMTNDLIRFRLLCEGESNPPPERVCEVLVKLVKTRAKLLSPRFTEFLRGKAGTRSDFWEDAVGILERCLLGDEPVPKDDDRKKIAEKIKTFFFQYGVESRKEAAHNERGFFDPLYKDLGCVQTANEANAELEVLRCYLRDDFKPRGDVLVVRTSGFRRFLQRDDGGGMNNSGILTLKLLNEGATVVYAYSKTQSESPAEQTAEAFQDFVNNSELLTPAARARLHLISMNPGKVGRDKGPFTAGAFLSPTLRFGYFRCTRVERQPDDDPILARTLIVTQKSRHSPSAYQPDARELEAFERWLRTFVLNEIGAKAKKTEVATPTKSPESPKLPVNSTSVMAKALT